MSTTGSIAAPPQASTGGAPGYLIFAGVAALVATLATAASQDPLFQFQGYIFMAAFVLAAGALTLGLSSGAIVQRSDQYMDGVVRPGATRAIQT